MSNNSLHLYSNDEKHSQITLNTCEDEKDIGVTIDNKLSFKKHIENKVAKANKMMGIIRRSFDYFDKKIVCSTVQDYSSSPFKVRSSCLFTIQERRHKGNRIGLKKGY